MGIVYGSVKRQQQRICAVVEAGYSATLYVALETVSAGKMSAAAAEQSPALLFRP